MRFYVEIPYDSCCLLSYRFVGESRKERCFFVQVVQVHRISIIVLLVNVSVNVIKICIILCARLEWPRSSDIRM